MKDRDRLIKSLRYPVLFVALLWLIKGYEIIAGIDLGDMGLGNYPRHLRGLVGVFTSPLIHSHNYDLDHLVSNSVPLLILGPLIIYFYPSAAKKVFAGIYLLSGIAVWLFARQVSHIGASGLVYGFAFFLFFSGVFRNDVKSLAISFFIIFMYGGIVWGLIPNLMQNISWESHLYGALAGTVLAYLFRYSDLPPMVELMDEQQPEISYRYIYVPKEKQGNPESQQDSPPTNQTGSNQPQ